MVFGKKKIGIVVGVLLISIILVYIVLTNQAVSHQQVHLDDIKKISVKQQDVILIVDKNDTVKQKNNTPSKEISQKTKIISIVVQDDKFKSFIKKYHLKKVSQNFNLLNNHYKIFYENSDIVVLISANLHLQQDTIKEFILLQKKGTIIIETDASNKIIVKMLAYKLNMMKDKNLVNTQFGKVHFPTQKEIYSNNEIMIEIQNHNPINMDINDNNYSETILNFKTFHYNSNKTDIIEKNQIIHLNEYFQVVKDNNLGILIKGYADNRGSSEYNLILSNKRAHSLDAMIENLHITKLRYIAEGESKPCASNKTKEGRFQNRRIEIFITE